MEKRPVSKDIIGDSEVSSASDCDDPEYIPNAEDNRDDIFNESELDGNLDDNAVDNVVQPKGRFLCFLRVQRCT
ncbi:hypothetical protein QE152_g9496 [Popillia japonica]|uniref:Uncharacterized protein n=1 Tax=Popillia japonica TaxID=7064 RepID=A0AAW1LYH6_POPJA